MALTKKLRFEVFKRDKFTCQYCGKSAPEVVLNVDHIQPKAKSGKDDILNLITSCFDCNQGKKDRLLSDNAVITKQKQQLDLLQERREQLDLLLAWQKELADTSGYELNQVAEYWESISAPFYLNDTGKEKLRKLLRTYGASEVVEAMGLAAQTYFEYADDQLTDESVERAWSKVGGICATRRKLDKEPHLQQLYYIRGILRNRLGQIDEVYTLKVLRAQLTWNVSVEDLQWAAKEARSISHWYNLLEGLRNEANPPEDVE
jgi:hypothetical protein